MSPNVAYTEARPPMGMSSYGQRAFLGPNMSRDYASKSPLVSPGSLDVDRTQIDERGRKVFEGYPPTYISAGGREILVDEITYLAGTMQEHSSSKNIPNDTGGLAVSSANGGATKGMGERYNWITLDVEPDMFHDFCSASELCRKETKRTLERAMAWMSSLPLVPLH